MSENPTRIGPALGDEDWAQLDALNMSSDPADRAEGQSLSKKLTFGEQKDFAAYQQKVRPKGINDTTAIQTPFGDISGEMLTLGALPIGRAVIGAGLSASQKAIAGVKAATANVAPVVKYEVAKGVLQHLGVPYPIAMPLAMAYSGYRKGGTAAAAEAEAATATKTPANAPTAPPTAPSSAAASSDLENFQITRAEATQAMKWHQQGVSPEEIKRRIEQSRLFTKATGGVTPDAAATDIEYQRVHGRRQQ